MVVKRHILGAVILLSSLLLSNGAQASDFWDLWLTPDQRGRWYFDHAQYDKAAQFFKNAEWKAQAFYKAEKFEAAALASENIETAAGQFLRGNAFARAEKLIEAIDAYKAALDLKPDFPEAIFNLKWVSDLYELDQKTYEDSGGTGGKLGADRTISNKLGEQSGTEVTRQQLKSEGLSDAQLEEMWMRRVQTTLGDFLGLRFSYQYQTGTSSGSSEETAN
ncbi:tetratricopeptide repeat protein [Sneathiella marina]|uniref:Tetratricopeptide repeat protein n=1 Tax=Sneathiella marina TaxID=2950108 RepID=A0ABY4VY90_9PROT|nr:tetratricopeptide repeat protein [Sneathiella marina]USG59805.1 tetratricopeptide repeat protein [Sneathiella marina]